METNKDCIIVFPVYRSLYRWEKECLKQAVAMTEGYRKVFIAPSSMTLDDSFGDLSDIDVVRFPDEYFSGVSGYNKLMLSIEFYQAFTDYRYLLIHQTDAYLFKPELSYWCDKDYDYVGAPWFKPHKLTKTRIYNFLLRYFPFLYSDSAKRRHRVYNNVGNGGLSLRKISSFLSVLNSVPAHILDKYKDIQQTDYNEDVFWGVEAVKINKSFKKPAWREALTFSFEEYPSIAYEMNGRQLPFGCHAFNVHETDFWKQFIPPLSHYPDRD